MPYAMETLINRLNKKNAAIAKRAATTMKHARRYLKNKATKSAEEMEWDFSYSEMADSAKTLRYLIQDRREILALIEDVKKNQVVLPEVLDNFRKSLAASFIRSRTCYRDHLQELYARTFSKHANVFKRAFGNYSSEWYDACDFYNDFARTYRCKPHFGPLTKRQSLLIKMMQIYNKAWNWIKDTEDERSESDEHLAKRSNKDAGELVEDLYKRTFGFTGKTTDYNGLNISMDNKGYTIINGFVEGEKGKCKVQSISAGGWNIQCWHIRVLVHAAA